MKIFFISFKRILLIVGLSISLSTLLAFSLARQSNYDYQIVLDPGHGGIDPGTNRGDLLEKDINLKIAKHLARWLENNNINVIMTRTDDSLYQDDRNKDIVHRVEIANQSNADLFVSLHVNSFPNANTFGGQAFYAPKSNSGKQVAGCIQERLVEIQPNNRRSITSAPYYVLKKTAITAVLVEVGFITNPSDRERISRSKEQEKIAQAIGKGIIDYLEQKKIPEQQIEQSLI